MKACSLDWIEGRGCLIVVIMLLPSATALHGQGIITFNAHPTFNGTDYYELGMGFHVVIPVQEPYHDWLVGTPSPAPANMPQNPTPYMTFLRQNSLHNYVAFSLVNGASFGLASVQLSDPYSPSYSLLPIIFLGSRTDGTVVTQTFTTPGGGANSFLTYQFNSDFASGLLSVKIDAPRWAMDNLVFTIPEPASGTLFLLGLLALAITRRRCRGWGRVTTRTGHGNCTFTTTFSLVELGSCPDLGGWSLISDRGN
jgi:hypothetical protein